ncbi:MAG: hypothetical protein NC911_05885, partial [Candidatus Omnitrophica bacterium]|nr:hypothetical protein [Candidatus Omnitrophota bacterium]
MVFFRVLISFFSLLFIVAAYPESVRDIWQKAEKAKEQGDIRLSVVYLRSIIENFPREKSYIEKAKAEIIHLLSYLSQQQVSLAREKMQGKDWQGAESALESILELDPYCFEALLLLYTVENKRAESLYKDYQQALIAASSGEIDSARKISANVEKELARDRKSFREKGQVVKEGRNVISAPASSFFESPNIYRGCILLDNQGRWLELAVEAKKIILLRPRAKKAFDYLNKATTKLLNEADSFCRAGKWESCFENLTAVLSFGSGVENSVRRENLAKECAEAVCNYWCDQAESLIRENNFIPARVVLDMAAFYLCEPTRLRYQNLHESWAVNFEKANRKVNDLERKGKRLIAERHLSDAKEVLKEALTERKDSVEICYLSSQLENMVKQAQEHYQLGLLLLEKRDLLVASKEFEAACLINSQMEDAARQKEKVDWEIKDCQEKLEQAKASFEDQDLANAQS